MTRSYVASTITPAGNLFWVQFDDACDGAELTLGTQTEDRFSLAPEELGPLISLIQNAQRSVPVTQFLAAAAEQAEHD